MQFFRLTSELFSSSGRFAFESEPVLLLDILGSAKNLIKLITQSRKVSNSNSILNKAQSNPYWSFEFYNCNFLKKLQMAYNAGDSQSHRSLVH